MYTVCSTGCLNTHMRVQPALALLGLIPLNPELVFLRLWPLTCSVYGGILAHTLRCSANDNPPINPAVTKLQQKNSIMCSIMPSNNSALLLNYISHLVPVWLRIKVIKTWAVRYIIIFYFIIIINDCFVVALYAGWVRLWPWQRC